MSRDFVYLLKSNPSLGQINMDIDDGPSLDIELSNDEDVFVPAVNNKILTIDSFYIIGWGFCQ